MSQHPRSRYLAFFLTLVALGIAPCAARGQETLGTITAAVDGQDITWYVVSMSVDGRPRASGAWYEAPTGDTLIVIGGLETENPPREMFQNRDPAQMSYGSYEGSLISIIVMLPGGTSSFSQTLPTDDRNPTNVSFQRQASMENVMETTYFMEEGPGTVEVTAAEIAGGRARIEGRFSGTLHLMTGDGPVEITGGTFTARGLPDLKEMTPGR